MAILLFDPQWIIDRLKDRVPALKWIGGAADFAAAAEGLKQSPAAIVLPSAERATGSSTGTLVTSQLNTARFAVAMAVQNLRDSRGEAAHADLRTLRTDIMTALHGWQPNADFDPIEFGGGRLLQLNNQVLWWQDDFLTSNLLRSL